jgi:hypothetical protein
VKSLPVRELAELLECCGQPAAADLQHEVERVIHATAANYSSMYQDVANAGAPKSATCWATPARRPPGIN